MSTVAVLFVILILVIFFISVHIQSEDEVETVCKLPKEVNDMYRKRHNGRNYCSRYYGCVGCPYLEVKE